MTKFPCPDCRHKNDIDSENCEACGISFFEDGEDISSTSLRAAAMSIEENQTTVRSRYDPHHPERLAKGEAMVTDAFKAYGLGPTAVNRQDFQQVGAMFVAAFSDIEQTFDEQVADLDDTEPMVVVQRHYLSDRVYQVMRKQTSPDEHFSVSDGVEIDPELRWSALMVGNAERPDDALEAFAVIFLDEENQPAYAGADLGVACPYALITYDPGDRLYHCEPVFTPQHGSLASIKAPNIDAVVTSTIAELDTLLKQHWWNLEPWLSASWGQRLLLLVSAFFWSILFLFFAIVLVIFMLVVHPNIPLDNNPLP